MEFFLRETFSVKLGYYTNYANSKEIKWGDSAIKSFLANTGQNSLNLSSDPVAIYSPSALSPSSRTEHVNTSGYCLGLSWSTARISITMTLIREKGKGASQIIDSQPSQVLRLDSTSVYLVASTHE